MVSGPYRPHVRCSPGCTRAGQMESYTPSPVRRYVSGSSYAYRPHNCHSPGCSRPGQMERVKVVSSNTTPKRYIPTSTPEKTVAASIPGTLSEVTLQTPEADPFKFTILRTAHNGGLTLAEINYHGCTNYEGRKVLLLKRTLKELVASESLDPHFLDNHENGLLARYVPTEEGWEMGLQALFSNLQTPK